ncbi:hypothetical protein BGZ63DRAFT_245396 [Mariannaea sp. PMI_226]|nr:hypothetical protein BGZ63DRAFT_245396 [Mariannaea sp. PMI_226]
MITKLEERNSRKKRPRVKMSSSITQRRAQTPANSVFIPPRFSPPPVIYFFGFPLSFTMIHAFPISSAHNTFLTIACVASLRERPRMSPSRQAANIRPWHDEWSCPRVRETRCTASLSRPHPRGLGKKTNRQMKVRRNRIIGHEQSFRVEKKKRSQRTSRGERPGRQLERQMRERSAPSRTNRARG